MQYWIEEESTKANCMKKSELLQLVEKKGKRASSIAWIICRTENRLKRLGPQSSEPVRCLQYRQFARGLVSRWRLYRDLNHIRVRNFILGGAPFHAFLR